MTSLRIADAAREDLRDIRAYSKSASGPRIARAYVEGLRERFALLRSRPLIGLDEADLGIGLRSLGYRSHRVYYRVETDTVLIVRILHHARDVPRSLGPEAS